MKPIPQRRLVDTSRLNITGEVLPPAELVPWEETEIQAARHPTPLISITLPRLAEDTDTAPAPAMTYERRTLQRQPSVETDFTLPLLQAFGMAWAALVLSGLLAWALSWSWKVPAVTFGAVLALALVARLRFMDSLLWATETITGHDLNGDGHTGQPAAFALVNPAAARADARKDVDATEQAAQRAELVAFVDRCYRMGTGERSHGVRASGSDRDDYVRMRDVLLSLGVAKWKRDGRPRAGWVMAVSRQKALQILAKHVL